MKKLTPLLMALALLVGCGKTAPTGIPAKDIKIPRESARVPEGARGVDKTHYVANPHHTFTLIGGQIHIDYFGVELIASFENIYEPVYCPYWDPYGRVWTRGFGETDWNGNFPYVNGTNCISHEQAVKNVAYLVESNFQWAVRSLNVNLSHDQVDALDDFIWNVGPGDLCCSIAYELQRRNFAAAGNLLLGYDHAGGVVLAGLYQRRLREDRLLQQGESPPKPKPKPTRHQLEAQLAAHKAESRHLEIQRRDIEHQLEVWGCRRLEREHRTRGPKCKGAEAAGQHVDAHGRLELHIEHKLENELR